MGKEQSNSDKTARVDSTNHTRTRRRLMTGGVTAGVTLPWLPQQWIKPAVESVMLPAHAQTSPVSAAAPCAESDVIDGMTFDCDDGPSCQRVLYDLEEGCLVRRVTACNGPTPDTGALDIEFEVFPVNNLIDVSVSNGTVGLNRSQFCDNPAFSDTDVDQELELVIAGQLFRATFDIGRTDSPTTVFVSDIAVAPA